MRVKADSKLGRLPSYPSLRRFMQAQGWVRRARRRARPTDGEERAEARIAAREVRSFEASHVHGLWHLDFHHGSRPVLTPSGEWKTPMALGVLDDRSRLACHVQWYLAETAENLVHAVCQALQKRRLPRALLTDNGAAMLADETRSGLVRLGILHETTLPYSPYQNAKQEVWWAQLEGRLIAMVEGVADLTLAFLNEATQAWVEGEYNRRFHSELGMTPLERLLAGPDAGRACPGSDDLRLAFMTQELRTQRRSDGTITLSGQRFELPSRYRHLPRVCLRYASWDLARVHLVDPRTDSVLCRIYPLDKERNADGRRRALPTPDAPAPEPRSGGVAPLLKKLMDDAAASGLPPAYLAKSETPRPPSKDSSR